MDQDSNANEPVKQDHLGTIYRRSHLKSIPKPEYLIENLLYRPAVAVLVGAYSSGKSILLNSWSGSLALGKPWMGLKVSRPAKVLTVVGESPEGEDGRITAWENAYNSGQPIPDDYLYFSAFPESLYDDDTWIELREFCRDENIEVINLDPLHALAPEMETKDASRIMRHAHELAAITKGIVNLVIHPTIEDKGRARDSYLFEALADLVFTLDRDGSELTLTKKKVKQGKGQGESVSLRIEATPTGPIISEFRNEFYVDRAKQVMTAYDAYFATGNGYMKASWTELINYLEQDYGVKGKTAERAVNSAVSEGYLTKDGRKYTSTRKWRELSKKQGGLTVGKAINK